MKKNAKGITLVAMVITIIVMLILAGVSISMVVGDNGVLTKGQKASKDTAMSSIESDIGLAVNGVQTDFMAEFADSTSAAGDKKEYLTMERMNEYLSECKIVYTGATDTQEIGVKIAGAAKPSSPTDKKATPLTNMNGIGKDADCSLGKIKTNKEGFSIGTSMTWEKGKKDTDGNAIDKPAGYIDSVGYVCNYLYFSNGKDANTLGGDLYVAIVHFEKGFLILDDIGIATKKGNDTELTQGALAKSSSLKDSGDTKKLMAEGLNVEWLKKDVGNSVFGAQ